MEQTIEEKFLEHFVKQLISHSKKQQIIFPQKQEIKSIPNPNFQIPAKIETHQATIQKIISKPIIKQQFPTPQQQRIPIKIPEYQTKVQTIQNINLTDKIQPILKDPRVQSIECLGPGKNIMVKKDGAVMSTSFSMSKEEIDSFLGNISKETKIPIIAGVFKAALNNLIITAVVSEYVGSRFIIQKRMPF